MFIRLALAEFLAEQRFGAHVDRHEQAFGSCSATVFLGHFAIEPGKLVHLLFIRITAQNL